MNDLRLISFLPAATEMACALGLEPQLVGVSHECDFPIPVRTKPIVVRCSLPVETMTLAEIDVVVSERIRNGQSIYEVDQSVVEQLAPTHILTQTLCEVCAPSTGEVARALKALPSNRIFFGSPRIALRTFLITCANWARRPALGRRGKGDCLGARPAGSRGRHHEKRPATAGFLPRMD